MSTSIEWTDETWNPTGGCERISPGCAHCYAKTQWDMRHKAHLSGKKMPAQYAQPFESVQLFPDRLFEPLSWRSPKRVFVNSVSDLFHEDVPDQFIDQVFAVMALAKHHTYQILTKRAERMRAYMTVRNHHGSLRQAAINGSIWSLLGTKRGSKIRHGGNWRCQWPLPNVWLGVSVENQHFADERIPLLLQTSAAVRFISAEPLLGQVDLSGFIPKLQPWKPYVECRHGYDACPTCDSNPSPALDWVIVGGESGPGARPFDLAWARSIVQQCQAAGVACFVKQVGAVTTATVRHEALDSKWRIEKDGRLRMLLADRKGGDPAEWPEDLRVRQFPEVRA